MFNHIFPHYQQDLAKHEYRLTTDNSASTLLRLTFNVRKHFYLVAIRKVTSIDIPVVGTLFNAL